MITPYYSRDGVVLYLGDCLKILPHLNPGSVDMVLTDPPYGINYHTGMRVGVVRTNQNIKHDLLTSEISNDSLEASMDLLARVGAYSQRLLSSRAVGYWFAAPLKLDTTMPILRRHWSITNVLVWDKGNGTMGDLQTTYSAQWEAILYTRRAAVNLIGGRDRDILRFSRGNVAEYVHPNQKPVPLLRYLISRHDSGLILDPFCGSGSTGVAALQERRKAILIEVSEAYCRIAANRLESTQLPLTTEEGVPVLDQLNLF